MKSNLFPGENLDNAWQFVSGVFTGGAGTEMLRRLLDLITGARARKIAMMVRVVNDFDAELDHVRDLETYAAVLSSYVKVGGYEAPVPPEPVNVPADLKIDHKALMTLRRHREEWQMHVHRLRVILAGAGVEDIEPPPDPPVWTSIAP